MAAATSATPIAPAVLSEALQRFESLLETAPSLHHPTSSTTPSRQQEGGEEARTEAVEHDESLRTIKAMAAIAALPTTRKCPAAVVKAALRRAHEHLADSAAAAVVVGAAPSALLLQFVPLIVDRVPPPLAADFFAGELIAASTARVAQVMLQQQQQQQQQDAGASATTSSAAHGDDPCRTARRALRAVRDAGALAFELTRVSVQLYDANNNSAGRPRSRAAATVSALGDDDGPTSPSRDGAAAAEAAAECSGAASFLTRFLARLLSLEVATAKAIGQAAIRDGDGSDDPASCSEAVWRLRCSHVATCEAIRASTAHIRCAWAPACGGSTRGMPGQCTTAGTASWTADEVDLLRRAMRRGRLADALAALGSLLDAPSVLLLVSRIDALQRVLDTAFSIAAGAAT